MTTRFVAHVNVATLRHPKGHPDVQPFFDAVPRINQLAEQTPGFVWRETRDDEEAKAAKLFGEPNLAIALSVWTDIASLTQFVYRSAHSDFLRQRTSWFTPRSSANKALWWIEPDHRPTVVEAKHRLDWLTLNGSGEVAFGFSEQFKKGTHRESSE
ncbi:MAG: DUF3291 domain-containing protein [Woeseiaceae bacterium]